MQQFFQQQYQGEVRDQIRHELLDPFDVDPNWSIAAAAVAFGQFRNILLVVNLELLILVPASAYLLTGRSLKPIEETHTREKQFVANVAHDLRTPLTIMSGELEIALQKKRTTHEYHSVVQSTKDEVQRLNELVEQLLFLANQDAEDKKIHLEYVDITDIVSSSLASFSSPTKQKNIQTNVVLPDKNVVIKGNATLLQQLFHNLIDNAVKYTEDNGKINVAFKDEQNTISITIKDTGIGIAEEDQKKIFDRFYRVDPSRSQIKGYGLGLSICQTIIDIHKGKLLLESKKNT
ncbi:MAG: sensor histidine kinase, partial [Rhabdochlamydiaceae bacterium]